MRYRGQLHVDDQAAAAGLPVELVLMDTRLAVHADGETIGRYPLGETAVERIGGDRFRLEIGSESLVFVADDALGFSYDALPFIRAGGSHPTSTGLRRFAHRLLGGRRRPDAGEGDADEIAVRSLEAPETVPAPDADGEPSSPEAEDRGEPSHVPAQAPEPPPVESVPSEEPQETSAPQRCASTMSDGSPCPMEPGPQSSLCHTHAARLDQQRADLHRRRDEAVAHGARPSLPDLDDVLGRLEKAVAQVHDGSLAPQQAQAMASLVQAMIETIELSSVREERSPT